MTGSDKEPGSPSDHHHHHHVSISALRNKFETLAHDTRDYVSKSRPVSPRPPATPAADHSAEATAPHAVDPPLADEPPVAQDDSVPIVNPNLVVKVPQPVRSKPKPPPKPASKPPPVKETTVVTAVGTPVNIPTAGSTAKVPPPRPPKPSASSSSASPKAPVQSPSPVSSPTPIYERYSRPRSPLCQPSPPPRVVASPESGPPSVAEESPAPAPGPIPAGPAGDVDEAPQSFAAIRERFAKGTAAAAPSSSGSLTANKPGDTPSTRSSSARTSPAPSVHVQAPTLSPPLKKEKPGSPHPPSSFVAPPLSTTEAPAVPDSRPKVASSGASTAEKSDRAPPPPPPISRSASPSRLMRSASPADSQRSASPANSAPGGHTLTASPVQSPVSMRSESPVEIDEPVQLDQAPHSHRPPPPPPPKSAAQRDEPVILQPTPTPHSHRPPPPPPKKSTTSVASAGSADSQTGNVPKPPSPVRRPTGNAGEGAIPVAPPPLPQRSNTLGPSPDSPTDTAKASSRPPLPGNKPAAPTPKSPSPPESVPQRPRSRTVAGARPAGAPPSPVRQNTMSTGHSPSPASRSRASSVADRGASPPPPQRSDTASTGLHRSSTVSSRGSGYAPPPRRDTISTPQRSGTIMVPADSDDEDDASATATPGLTSMAARSLEEHPDGSQANRRPPQFSPDIEIKAAHSITAFTVYGRFVVCAHHHVKVYDSHLPEGPILDFDPKHMGSDSKVKEPRVTSSCFRPSTNDAHEGRYSWCGNRDGHIWELDIRTGEITATHPGVHSAAVTHIMRSGRNMVTLDEFGKLNVWEVPTTDGPEDEGGVRMVRNLRITEKPTFVKMIRGQSWAATAPAVRSTTNSATARGPTVRVWDITYPGTAPPPLMASTTEWTGSATSAAVMPLDPSITYIGHEGGFVSFWTISDGQLQCVRVSKVSSTDISSSEGVGERSWAGNRRGEIHAWKLDEMPWVTTNIWNAHGDQPVHTLVVDPYSIEATRRFMAWSCSRDTSHAWDGSLAIDWIDCQMVARQEQYCEFREVRILICSWNIDSAKPTDLVGGPNSNFLPESLSSVESPDIIVFGFQEVIPSTDKKSTAKTLLFGKGGSDRVSGVYQAWAEKLSLEVRKNLGPYTKVHSEQLVGLFAVMFVKTESRDSSRDVSVSTVKRGIGGMYGNKGALVARMVSDDTSICFINVHSAAGQRHKAARNADVAAIMDDKAVFPPADKLPYVHGGDGSGISDHEFVISNGDSNYRIDQRRDVVISASSRGDLASSLEHDQSRKEMKSNHAFRSRYFAEAPIDFLPTYKYDPGTDEYDSSEKKRIPAWCDRILFTSSPRISAINYRRYEPTVSDHKPVSAASAVQVKRVIPDRMRKVQREIDQDWQSREAELLVKMADAYKASY